MVLEMNFPCWCSSSIQSNFLRVQPKTDNSSSVARMDFRLSFNSDRYEVKEQYVVYDGNAFFADVGGFLGLLLGHSVLSVYSSASVTCMKKFGKHT